jgi:hypothetical protein
MSLVTAHTFTCVHCGIRAVNRSGEATWCLGCNRRWRVRIAADNFPQNPLRNQFAQQLWRMSYDRPVILHTA